jgi:diguanylate cyclase (GGDEF)-like protein
MSASFGRGDDVRTIILAILFLVGWQASAAAQEVVKLPLSAAQIELMGQLRPITSEKKEVAVEVPADLSGRRAILTLSAKGEGASHTWFLFTLANSGAEPQEVILDISHQHFAGSGVVTLKPFGSTIINTTISGQGAEMMPVPAPSRDSFKISLEANRIVTIVLEADPAMQMPLLWQRAPFEAQATSFAFFRGAVLGIAFLLTVAMVALYGIRSHPSFIAGGLFGLASLGFIVLEAGYLPALTAYAPWISAHPSEARAMAEGLLMVSLFLCLIGFSDVRRQMPRLGIAALVLAALSLAVPLYGVIEPIAATSIARISFLTIAAVGFPVIFLARRNSDLVGDGNVLLWALVLVWTCFAVMAALAERNLPFYGPLLSGGLAAVLVAMGFILAQFAFNQGFLSKRFFADAGRRGLALAGARHIVWDWQPVERNLDLAPELMRSLGFSPTPPEEGLETFIDLIHPADRPAYLQATEESQQLGTGFFTQVLRLRTSDGGYRWFELRASAVAGSGRRAARCIGTLTDISGAKRHEERLITDAVYDRVTGLPNRALFMDRLERDLRHGAGRPPRVLLIDLDRFKALNEGLGHEVGDNLLLAAGRRIADCLKDEDTLARLSGAQFAVITGGGDEPAVQNLAQRITGAIAAPVQMAGQEVFLSAAIGMSMAQPAEATPDLLMKQAAVALYEAKRAGNRRVTVFAPSMQDERTALVVLEAELRRAVERSELEVHYQPIARLTDMELAGFEALLRWRHPKLGLLGPESFITLAEQTGMIVEVGRFVLHEAARQLGIWQRAHRPATPVFMAINVSAGQLLDNGLLDDVRAVLQREAIHRGTLKLEVTESLLMQFPERAAGLLARLKQMGVGIACDDFGTGHSALASLRDMPFDTLKIDRSFVTPSGDDPRAASILDAIIALAHGLGMAVVAEGLETDDQIERLAEAGCDFGQGFLIGQPMTAKQVGEALATLPLRAEAGASMAVLWDRAAIEPPPQATEQDLIAATEKLTEPESTQPVKPSVEPAAPPPLGAAPMAPRRPRPEELPSIFAVSSRTPATASAGTAKRKSARKRTPVKKKGASRPAKEKASDA